MQDSILTTVVKTIDGEVTTLEKYAGNVLLIVNVASKCGLTPQYEQLENIQKAWADRGFIVLGFPCNQFLEQEPGSAAAPTAVAPEESGFYARLASKGRAPLYPDDILWNFEKFLVGRDGKVIQRFSPDMTPEDPIVMESIKLALAK
ncbi:glutathione peroxidase [Escherichia marmotae]|uniref:glutathione peroxidase n=1 Tax=Escherichia marmotae TaxID=1499973 RepID=UPI000571B544|nr:glutathione peroxidase [Escherichia marmotae]AUT26342.1 glutathione peroxidase [Escherichia marmotae]